MHEETHSVTRISWLRAAILGANDGIVSTASLIAGVSAAGASEASILITGAGMGIIPCRFTVLDMLRVESYLLLLHDEYPPFTLRA